MQETIIQTKYKYKYIYWISDYEENSLLNFNHQTPKGDDLQMWVGEAEEIWL